ncbi:MAG: CHAD domain-containing protein [Planctomycetota bacterium]|nr:CHAD domain-containing protein [Planctomycetota bacterium]
MSAAREHSSERLEPGTLLHVAAAQILGAKLRAVEQRLAKLEEGARAGEVEADDVHQTRVAVRRATAVLRTFAPCVRDIRLLRRVKKRLRSLRQVIGAARSCDVSAAILGHDYQSGEGAGREQLAQLIRTLKRRRKRSMKKLAELVEDVPARKLAAAREKLVGSIGAVSGPASTLARGAPTMTMGDAATISLRRLVSELRLLGSGPLSQAAPLHELRLGAKRLRYTLEIFAPCFDAARLDDVMSLMVRMQDRLGAANDLAELVGVVDGSLEKAWDAPSRELDALLSLRAGYHQRCEEAQSEFERWWRLSGEAELVGAFERLLHPEARFGPVTIAHAARNGSGSSGPAGLRGSAGAAR